MSEISKDKMDYWEAVFYNKMCLSKTQIILSNADVKQLHRICVLARKFTTLKELLTEDLV